MEIILKISFEFLLLFYALNCFIKAESKVSFSEINTEENNIVDIRINFINNSDVSCSNGTTFYFPTDFNDKESNIFDISDIEENTAFNTSMVTIGNSKVYNITCKLWKPINDYLKLICKINDVRLPGHRYTYINQYSFIYKSYLVNIIPPLDYQFFLKRDLEMPFLYSDEQIISVEDWRESYELKFKMEEYNDNLIYLFSNESYNEAYIYLDKCSKEENYLICIIGREEIEDVIQLNNQIFNIYSLNNNLIPTKIDLIYNITIIDNSRQKQIIYVEIKRLLQDLIRANNYITYETNITDISNVTSGKFFIQNEQHDNMKCYFKKNAKDPLLFLCKWKFENKDYLGEFKEEIIIYYSSIKYVFRIQPIKNNDIFQVFTTGNIGNVALFVFPKVIDFNLKESYTITYIMSDILREEYYKLNLDSESFRMYKGTMAMECYVYRKHFENKKSGYYYTYHDMSPDYSILYDFSPIQVIIPNDKRIYIKIRFEKANEIRQIGNKGTLFFSTLDNDYDTNKLDASDLKEISIQTTVRDLRWLRFEVNCKLWKTKDKKIKVICNLITKLSIKDNYSGTTILFNEVEFNYKNYTFFILATESFIVNQLNYNIPLLYSDSQTLKIREEINDYNLRFIIELYNNELLIIYNSDYNSMILDNCNVNNKILNCKISREKLEEIITTKNNFEFKVSAINDDVNSTKFDFVSPILIDYDIYNKIDILVGITEILGGETGQVIFKTNITSIPNLISAKFDEYSCYFKKTKLNPLFIFCSFSPSSISHNYSLDNEKILDNIHYKYNFRIQPYNLNSTKSIFGFGTNLFLVYPEELNFESQNSVTILFFMGDYVNNDNFAIIYPDTKTYSNITYLNCDNLGQIKKCRVPISHFIRQNYEKNEYGYIFYVDNKNVEKIDYGLHPIKVILPKQIVHINIDNDENLKTQLICQNGIFYLITNYNDEKYNIFCAYNIEEKTTFKTTITNKLNISITYDINCRLWKPKNGNLILICRTREDLYITEGSSLTVYFDETAFNYNDYRVVITSNSIFHFDIINTYCSFIYADKQIINIKEENEIYELHLLMEEYNNEPLLISNSDSNYINVDNCSKDGKNLICQIKKEKLLEYNNNQKIKLYHYNELYGFLEFSLIKEISINYLNKKENLYVKITKLLQKNIDLNNHISYETNISSISNLVTDFFILNTDKEINCYFKKNEINPLLILCRWPFVGEYKLGEIKKDIMLDNIHIKYNFLIKSGKNDELFNIEGLGSLALFVFPTTLNFYLNDSLTILIRMDFPENSSHISLNSLNLNCENSLLSSFSYKRCKVNINEFRNSTNKYYSIYHRSHLNESVIFYELAPLEVKMPKDNEINLRITKEDNVNSIKIGNKGILFFITNFYDYENKLNYDDIESKSSFESKVIDKNNNEYNVKCRLWKPKYDKIRLICNLNENLKYASQKVFLKDISLYYNNYIIHIFSDAFIDVNQINYDLSFLYSEKQNIFIDDNTSIFYLTFKIETYENDILYLYGSKNNYLVLDNCTTNFNKFITCAIIKDKLYEIITREKDFFSIGALNDNFGVYLFNNILPIEIRINLIQKENITVHLGDPFAGFVQVGVPFGFTTNVTEFPNLITEKFNDNLCYMKKMTGIPLLLICLQEKEQMYYFYLRESYLDHIHWKYNFILTPSYRYHDFYVESYGADIKFAYPLILDFSKNDEQVIRYITSTPSLINNIKLKKTSSDIECKDLHGMKKCLVSFAHFKKKSDEIYYTYYKNHLLQSSIYDTLTPFEVIFPLIHSIELIVDDENNKNIQYIGQNKILYFITNYSDTSNIFDLNENSKFSFNAKFSNDKNNKVIKGVCNIWKPYNDKIRLICKLEENFDNEEQIIYLNEYSSNYKDCKIMFYTTAKNLLVHKLNSNIAFLYSDRQVINIENNIDSYELKFNKEYYHKEQLILYKDKLKRIYLDCNDDETEVKCIIKKEKLTQILSYSGEKFYISQMTNSEGILPIESILEITINYINPPEKQDIYIEIKKLLTPIVKINNYIAYETNITNIPNITTSYFSLAPIKNLTNCLFKTNNEKILILCSALIKGENYFGKVTGINPKDINILYNFIFRISRNYGNFSIIDEESAIISSVYPEELDFNKQNSFIINYEVENPELLTGIILNNESNQEFQCYDKNRIKECIVNQNHFAKSGYYNTFHDYRLNNSKGKLIAYETKAIKVILKNDSDSDAHPFYMYLIIGCIIGALVIIGIIVFIVLRCKRKKYLKNSDKKMELITKKN